MCYGCICIYHGDTLILEETLVLISLFSVIYKQISLHLFSFLLCLSDICSAGAKLLILFHKGILRETEETEKETSTKDARSVGLYCFHAPQRMKPVLWSIFRCFTYVPLIGPLAQSLLNPLSNLSMPLGIAVGAFTLSGLLNLKTIQPNNSYQT